MSKPRDIWWSYAKGMIRQYPELKKELADLREQKVTASMTGVPGGGGAARTTENVSLRQLPGKKQEEFDAVDLSIKQTRKMKNGKYRLQVISLVYWKEQLTIEGAALRIPCSKETAWRYHRDFVRLVGKNRGLSI